MELSLSVILFCAFAFLIAGFVDAVAGGGGLISMPALLLAGVPPHMALGSGKFATTLGSLTALWSFARHHLVVTRIAPAGFASAFFGAVSGSGLAMQVESVLMGRILVFLPGCCSPCFPGDPIPVRAICRSMVCGPEC